MYFFEVLDSYLDIENPNSIESKGLQAISKTILDVFEELYENNETLYRKILKENHEAYKMFFENLNHEEKMKLAEIGSHHTANSSDLEGEEFERYMKEFVNNKEEDEDDDKEEEKKKKKKKNQGFNMADLQAL